MADMADDNGAGSKAGWSEGEKYQFLLKIINQLSGEKSVKLGDIDMPGRTTKALTHQWAKIRSDAAAASGSAGGAGGEPASKVTKKPATTRKKKVPELDGDGNPVKATRKRKPKAPVADVDDEEES